MNLNHWLERLKSRIRHGSRRRAFRSPSSGLRWQFRKMAPQFEPLEDRTLLTLLVVDTNSDVDDGDYSAGNLSLREAVALANANSGADTITFGDGSASGGTNFLDASPDTITLGGSQLDITDAVTITGPGADLLTISGNNVSRVFYIDDGNAGTLAATTIEYMTIASGRAAPGAGGGIYSKENLTLRNCTVTGNYAQNGASGLYNYKGNADVQDSIITGNTGHGSLVNFQGTLSVRN